MVWCGLKDGCLKYICFNEVGNWTTCLEYDNHSRFNNQYNWMDLYDHLKSTRIFNLIMNKTFK